MSLPGLQLRSYARAELPEPLFWQILTFDRIEWHDRMVEHPEPEILPASWQPVHFVLAQGAVVISHAAVVRREIVPDGAAWTAYGLSSVYTFPAFRGRGHGRTVVEAASAHIDRTGDGDLALLFPEPHNQRFYAGCGWQALPSTVILAGERRAPWVNPDLAMLRPLSTRVDAALLAERRLYIGQQVW